VIEVPVLETERLVLRGWREDDLDAYAAMLADPEVAQFIWGALSRHDAWRNLALMAGHWAVRGYGFWAVERKLDRALLGRVGLWNPEGWPNVEVGWALVRHAWGQGFATEAARAARDYGFRTLDVPKLVSHIDSANTRSQAVARRLHETLKVPVDFEHGRRRITAESWEITRAEWEELR
jgi:RimJ/RimL family protein N-acetyltransferase